jgi:hypothetical protein
MLTIDLGEQGARFTEDTPMWRNGTSPKNSTETHEAPGHGTGRFEILL